MIVNFLQMGALYQHDEYDTLVSAWSSYPWSIGTDVVSISCAAESFAMSQMIWDQPSGGDENNLTTQASVYGASMFAELIVMDNIGNVGSAVGFDPPSAADLDAIQPALLAVNNITLTQILIVDTIDDADNSLQPSLLSINEVTLTVSLVPTTIGDEENTLAPANLSINSIVMTAA